MDENQEKKVSSLSPETEAPARGKEKSKAQKEFSNLHPLRARLYDNVNLSLNTMNIVVAVVAIALVAVFIYGVATGTRA